MSQLANHALQVHSTLSERKKKGWDRCNQSQTTQSHATNQLDDHAADAAGTRNHQDAFTRQGVVARLQAQRLKQALPRRQQRQRDLRASTRRNTERQA